VFAQDSHFFIDNKHLVWQKTFPTFDNDVMKKLVKYNNKINSFSDAKKGAVNNAQCLCKLIGFMDNQTFDFLFELETTVSNYTITVYDITIDTDNELDYAENVGIEVMFLNNSGKDFQKAPRIQKNLECFDQFLIKTFELPF
jgi:hypothetical protein